jgi:hypothetical protein
VRGVDTLKVGLADMLAGCMVVVVRRVGVCFPSMLRLSN